MRYVFAAAALVLAAPLNAGETPPQSEWTQVHSDEDGAIFIRDKDWFAGRPDSTSVLVWVWMQHKNSPSVSHTTMLTEINCPAEAYRYVQMHDFDHKGKQSSLGGGKWEFASPETVIGEVVKATCMEPGSQDEPQQPENFW